MARPDHAHVPQDDVDLQPSKVRTDDEVVVSHPTRPGTAGDGLPACRIRPHTHDKFDRHRAYCAIFNRGMYKKWPDNRGYLELFASNGIALDGADEVDGCPMLAAACQPPFSRMALVELNPAYADALERRLCGRGFGEDVARVFCGDANDPAVLAEAMAFLPSSGLTFAFIDPEDINGDWDAVKYLAALRRRGQRIDFLINLPIGPMKRNYDKAAKAVTAVLGTEEWYSRVKAGDPLGRVFRETYALQFKRIGLAVAEHMEIRTEGSNTPVYDLVFASGDPKGIEFWQKIQGIKPGGQRKLF